MEKQVTKNQHFVPQLLLRNFSIEENGEYRCSVFDIQREQVRHRQNVKNVCSRNFMYDKDNSVEDFLSKNIESDVSEEIEAILLNPYRIVAPPSLSLLRFITVQLGRTQQAYEKFLDFANSYMKTVFEELARLNDLDVEAAKKLSIKPNDPSAVVSHQTLGAALDWPLIRDLHHHVVINTSSMEFVLSDHPVFQYNWYLRDSDDLAVSSIGSIGVQLFIPLSPEICYCLYDPGIYKYGSAKRAYTEVERKEDVGILNSFQALNAASTVAFKGVSMEALVRKQAKKFGRANTYTSEAAYQQARDIGEGKMKSTHVTWLKQTRVYSMPSFVKIKKKAKRCPVVARYRHPEIMDAVYAYKSAASRREKHL